MLEEFRNHLSITNIKNFDSGHLYSLSGIKKAEARFDLFKNE